MRLYVELVQREPSIVAHQMIVEAKAGRRRVSASDVTRELNRPKIQVRAEGQMSRAVRQGESSQLNDLHEHAGGHS